MVMFTKGDYIWIAPTSNGEFAVPVGARVLEAKNDGYFVEDDDGNKFNIQIESKCHLMHPSSIKSIPDMTALGELNECGILRNLFLRYHENQIYTYTGSILIAINPYRPLPIYSTKTMREYSNKGIGELPPHLFAIGDNAYRNMCRNLRDQCIIISGESGAGKTESTKLLLQFITTVSGQESCIGKQILDSNPIMEAFGNAKTVRNDNSSRFGKYVDIHFDQNSGFIVSARIEQYLLEKSRIVTQAPGERNYHAFYCMIAGMPMEDKRRLGLKDVRFYNYLVQEDSVPIDSKNDATHFENIISTMRYLKFTDCQIDQIWHLLAAILHLGNIAFCETLKESTDASKVDDSGRCELRYASTLLGMLPSALERAMTTRQIHTAGECVVAQVLPANAHAVRDAFAKTIYDELFRWIVEKINAAIYRPLESASVTNGFPSQLPVSSVLSITSPMSSTSRPISVARLIEERFQNSRIGSRASNLVRVNSGESRTWLSTPLLRTKNTSVEESDRTSPTRGSSAGPGRISIGVLDIFGFENFCKNSFEQLCINYANENIQQYFVRHIFKLEQEEYLAENISWTHIKFQDNQNVLDLIAHHPLNVLALIDEESRFPKGTDESFLNKLNNRHASTPNYVRAVSTAEQKFGIHHFAGPVFYEVDGFLEKNRDTFNNDLLDVINNSTNNFLRGLFGRQLKLSTENRARSLTLSMQFKRSLERLMQIINGCHPFFVRCIKPNEFKLPNCFDRDLCVRQLRYSGMMETIQIRQLGYPIRYDFTDFINRFRMIVRPCLPSSHRCRDLQKATQKICSTAFLNDDTYAVGKTKVFLRRSHDIELELLREKIVNRSALLIQSQWRGLVQRKWYCNMLRVTINCQKCFRNYVTRRIYLRNRQLVCRLQANVRCQLAQRAYQKTRMFLIDLQTQSRGWLAKKMIVGLMKEKQFFTADLVLVNTKTTNLFECDDKVIEDTDFDKQMNAGCLTCPVTMSRLDVISVCKEVPEKCHSRQFARFSGKNPTNSTQVVKPHTLADFDSLVDRIFDDVFNSPGAKNIMTPQSTAINTVTVRKEKRKPSFPELSSGVSADLPIHVAVIDNTVGVTDVNDSRVKAKLITADTKTVSLPSFAYAVSEGDQSTCTSTATTTALNDFSTTSHVNECAFLKFAAAYFQTGSTPYFTTASLLRPLFKHRNHRDLLLALDIFSKIQIFMKPKKDLHFKQANEMPAMPTGDAKKGLKQNLWVNGSQSSCGSSVSSRASPNHLFTTPQSKRQCVVLINGMASAAVTNTSSVTSLRRNSNEPISEATSSVHSTPSEAKADFLADLQTVRFIVAAGIEHAPLRDEIYCQILKQISKNPIETSRYRGWILLSLCASCFPPTNFDSAFRSYLKSNPSSFSRCCLKRLRLIYQTGVRSKPPSYMEFKAAQEGKSLIVNIHCADNTRVKVKVEPAVTVKELSETAFKLAGITDTFGFEVFINIFDKSYSLSLGPDHLFDTISFCEHHARNKGMKESDLPWSFLIRKTIFAPWHDVEFDSISTSLICFQVCQQCFTEAHEALEEHELAFLLANVFKLLHADMLQVQNRKQLPGHNNMVDINSWLVDILSPECDVAYWQRIVSASLIKLESEPRASSPFSTHQSIVKFAKDQWPAIFAREYEVSLIQHDHKEQDVLLTVDCNGINLYDEHRALFTKLEFIEIHSVCVNSIKQQSLKVLSLKTVWMKEYRFLSARANDLKDLLMYMLTGLRQRSRYSIAMRKFQDENLYNMERIQIKVGDYIILSHLSLEIDPSTQLVGLPYPLTSETRVPGTHAQNLLRGENTRTKQVGSFPISHIYILPTIDPPKAAFVDAFSKLISSADNKDWLNMAQSITQHPKQQMHLQKPQLYHAANSVESLLSKSIAAVCEKKKKRKTTPSCSESVEWSNISSKTSSRGCNNDIYSKLRHTRHPAKQPFLIELASTNQKIYDSALLSFCIIQMYMGDCEKVPATLAKSPAVFLTDLLFGSALGCPMLCDELYIQLMNQLTKNPQQLSAEKGWELMWLASGVMVPSNRVINKLISFLHVSSHPLASQCYIRLHHTKSRGFRKKPPHPLELSTIQAKKQKIPLKVIFSKDASTMLSMESNTKATDVISDVGRELCFAFTDSFALYAELDGEFRCIQNDEFVLDCLRAPPSPSNNAPGGTCAAISPPPHAQLYFKRKFWLNPVPGQDCIEDSVINFPQEMFNFLRGYHRCTFEQVLELSTLLYILKSDDIPKKQLALNEILPANMLSHVSEARWFEKLHEVAKANKGITRTDIPLAFLECLYTVPTFGSSFFEIKSCDSKEDWILAINKEGISFMPSTKDGELVQHSLYEISRCWCENHLLNFIFQNNDKNLQWICTDIAGYNSSDLINCYIRYHKFQTGKP